MAAKEKRTSSPIDPLRQRQLLFLVFFFAVYFYLLYQLARVLSPFLAPLHPVADFRECG